jgi:hypothetical protein
MYNTDGYYMDVKARNKYFAPAAFKLLLRLEKRILREVRKAQHQSRSVDKVKTVLDYLDQTVTIHMYGGMKGFELFKM